MVESAIERILRQKAIERGGVAIKWQGERGVPDRIVMLPGGRIAFVETKTKVGRVSERQQFMAARLGRLGFEVRVLRSAEEIEAFFEDMDYTERQVTGLTAQERQTVKGGRGHE